MGPTVNCHSSSTQLRTQSHHTLTAATCSLSVCVSVCANPNQQDQQPQLQPHCTGTSRCIEEEGDKGGCCRRQLAVGLRSKGPEHLREVQERGVRISQLQGLVNGPTLLLTSHTHKPIPIISNCHTQRQITPRSSQNGFSQCTKPMSSHIVNRILRNTCRLVYLSGSSQRTHQCSSSVLSTTLGGSDGRHRASLNLSIAQAAATALSSMAEGDAASTK